MADADFIFTMKPYDIDVLATQVAWLLEKRVELASRKRLPGLWKLTDKLNAVPRASEEVRKHRRERRRRWGGLFLVMGIFLFVPGAMRPQELPGPLFAGFFAIVLGVLYLRKEDRKKKGYEKKAKQLLEKMNLSLESGKLRLILEDTQLVLHGAGWDEKVPYASVECELETTDLFALIYNNRMLLLQKQELILGTEEEFRNRVKAVDI